MKGQDAAPIRPHYIATTDVLYANDATPAGHVGRRHSENDRRRGPRIWIGRAFDIECRGPGRDRIRNPMLVAALGDWAWH
jgi:hypothetical protein